MQTPITTQQPPERKELSHYERYTMLGFYTPQVAKQKGRTKQTFRADITQMQYADRGMNFSKLHPLAILEKKFIEHSYEFYKVIFYDNYLKVKLRGQADQQVLKIIIHEGVITKYDDHRSNYYDQASGEPFKCPLNSAPNQNL